MSLSFATFVYAISILGDAEGIMVGLLIWIGINPAEDLADTVMVCFATLGLLWYLSF